MAKEVDDADAWGAELDGKDAPAVGVNREMLRKALSLNPALKKHATTNDIMNQLDAAQAQRTVATPDEPRSTAPTDLVEGLTTIRQRTQEDRKRLKEDIAKLQAQEKSLLPRALDRVIDMIIALDPNMTSVQTTELLKMEAVFLNEIGFSPRKVIDKKMQKKK